MQLSGSVLAKDARGGKFLEVNGRSAPLTLAVTLRQAEAAIERFQRQF